ncbi:unnamed protein product [Kuraishia capsulata CBS 1993]|uniref:Uncharacterized protein n=1 Tax=Kuraishia capsulata CBS 1993 TaxID=1382522 RepID=W6MSS3_9ASCO|nr:uncharacterized protein KUCA_T00005757001 [Kuraishia capsulata CBS 1993]CDK29764.1 unnamed protein product [Kuraishia capsulata CBS 1993]
MNESKCNSRKLERTWLLLLRVDCCWKCIKRPDSYYIYGTNSGDISTHLRKSILSNSYFILQCQTPDARTLETRPQRPSSQTPRRATWSREKKPCLTTWIRALERLNQTKTREWLRSFLMSLVTKRSEESVSVLFDSYLTVKCMAEFS